MTVMEISTVVFYLFMVSPRGHSCAYTER